MSVILKNQDVGLSYRDLCFSLNISGVELQELIHTGIINEELEERIAKNGDKRYFSRSQRMYREPLRMVPVHIFKLYMLLEEHQDGCLFSDLRMDLNMNKTSLESLLDQHEIHDFLQYTNGPDERVRTLLDISPRRLVQPKPLTFLQRFWNVFGRKL